jgi:hypothetical protein
MSDIGVGGRWGQSGQSFLETSLYIVDFLSPAWIARGSRGTWWSFLELLKRFPDTPN